MFVARPNLPFEFFDLILAGFDRQPGNVMVFRQRAQFVKTYRLVSAWCVYRIVTNREIPNPDTLAFGRNQWIARRKNPLIGLKDLPILGDIVL